MRHSTEVLEAFFNKLLKLLIMNSIPEKHNNVMNEAYIKKSENSLHNTYYKRHAVKALLEEISEYWKLDVQVDQ